MKPIGKIAWCFMLIIALSYLYIHWKINSELDKCSNVTMGCIKEIAKQRNKGDLVKMEIVVNNHLFNRYLDVGHKHQYSVGDSLRVRFACSNPNLMKIDVLSR